MRLFALLIASCLLLVAPARSQAEITSLAEGETPRQESVDLRLERFADFSEITRLTLGEDLGVGDLLKSVSGTTDVELACGEASLLRFSGGFRVVINPPGETDCAVNLLSGQLDVLTDEPTEISAGGVVLGSEGTQFAVKLERTADGPRESVVVYDGQLSIAGRTRDNQQLSAEPQKVTTGQTWGWDGKEAKWGQLSSDDLQRAAKVYARLDLAKSQFQRGTESGTQAKISLAELEALHVKVLHRPADEGGRAALAKAQLDLQIDQAAVYNLKRVQLDDDTKLRAHQIDPAVIPKVQRDRLYAPKTLPQRELQVRHQPIGQLSHLATITLTPWTLLDQEKYAEAKTQLQKLVRESPSARAYCGLAQAYGGVDGWTSRKAGAYAGRALRLADQGQEIPAAELRICRILNDLRPTG